MKGRISVIIPVYNVEPYLDRCMDSIVNNTYRNLEIICVNDGSTDNCGVILDRYARNDERIRVIYQKNGGVSAARNAGMDAATGDFVAFVDPDDWIHPQYFEILVHIQKKANYDLVICGNQRTDKIDEFVYFDVNAITESPLDLAGIYMGDAYTRASLWAKLYRMSIVNGKRFIEGLSVCEDVLFNANVLRDVKDVRACYFPLSLYYYYNRHDSLIHRAPMGNELVVAEKLYEYAESSAESDVKHILLQEGLKRCLSARYELTVFTDEKDSVRACDKQLRRMVKQLFKIGIVSGKDKWKWIILAYCPFLFRLYLIVKNPALPRWERERKKLLK